MEAASDYWKAFHYLLEDAGFKLMLVNARHVENMPIRKADVTDAAWLTRLGAHGLVRASLVPRHRPGVAGSDPTPGDADPDPG